MLARVVCLDNPERDCGSMNTLKTRPGRKRPPGPSARDLGLTSADAGKGDAARNCFSEEFQKNFGEIRFPKSDEGFVSTGVSRKVKTYK